MDIGAFEGDTTLWFSNIVGPEGRVFAFEPFDKSYKLLVENIERNNVKNVVPIPKALYRKSGAFSMIGHGQGAALVKSNYNSVDNSNTIETITLDEYTQLRNLPGVDFIKMDIEGAEVAALEGVVNTIKKHLPQLAISVYRKGSDIVAVPELIKRIEPSYKLYLHHRSKSWGDTILYAET